MTIFNPTDKNITKLQSEAKLTGELTLQDYPQLEEIYLPNHQLTILTVKNCPNLKEINLKGNELTSLNLNCPNLEKLIIPDNPYLAELKGLNLSKTKHLNISNTLINLNQDYEQLKQERDDLLTTAKGTKKAIEEGELILPTQFITTLEQADEAIQKHLAKIEREWREYFANPEQALPAFQLPEWRREAKKVLIWVIEAQDNSSEPKKTLVFNTNKNYQELVDRWNAGSEYNAERDFDCGSLSKMMDLLKTYNHLKKETTSVEVYE